MVTNLARKTDTIKGSNRTSSRWSFEWMYFSLTMFAWFFTPLLRRLIDYRAGAFNPVQLVTLLPFVMLLPLAAVCLREERFKLLQPLFRWLVFAWVVSFLYGFLISAAIGNVAAAMFSFVQYVVPALAGMWFAGQTLPIKQSFERLSIIILSCAAIVGIYGIAQWIDPPPWDVLWVEGSHFTWADLPVPFGMRVFSTLNSPEPAADFFAMTIVFVLPRLRVGAVWTWPLLSVLGAALLLTLVREAWVGLIFGTLAYLVFSPRRLSTLPLILIFVVLLSALAIGLPSLLGSGPSSDVIVSRIATFTNIGHDESALARQWELRDAFAKGFNNPIGDGLGNIGVGARLGGAGGSDLGTALDSGYLSRLIELGWLGFIGYTVVVLGGPLYYGCRILRQRTTNLETPVKVIAATGLGICATLCWDDVANDAHYGIDGVLFWLGLSLASSAIRTCAPVKPNPCVMPKALPSILRN